MGASVAAALAVAAGEDGGAGGAVDLGQGHEHGGLDRPEPLRAPRPLAQRLELQRLGVEVGHVERAQRRGRALGVVVGRAADEVEARERHQRVDAGGAAEVGVDRGARVEAAREGRQDAQALGLQRADHRVVMRGVRGQDVGAQHHEADGGGGALDGGKLRGVGGDAPARQVGVVEAGLGVLDGGCGAGLAPGGHARVARHQRADHVLDVVVRPAEPVLHREEPLAQVLRAARHQLEDPRDPAQHLHLARARAGLALGLRLELLEERHRARGGLRHVQIAHPREPHDLGVGDDANDGVAMLAPRGEVGQHGADVLLQEEDADDQDVGRGDRLARGVERARRLGPFGGGVDRKREAGEGGAQARGHARGRAGGVPVERHDDDVVGGVRGRERLSAHSGPSPRRGCRA